jgi:hypothetical protein
MNQIAGVDSIVECSSYVYNTFRLKTPGSMANAFRYFGTSCEIGRVSPLYGFLEKNDPLPVGKDTGLVLTGCLGMSE